MEWTENNTSGYRLLFKHFCDLDAIDILNEQLKAAEYVEDYEECCVLRDMINELKEEQN